MSEKQELYYPYENTDRFVIADIATYYQEAGTVYVYRR